MTISQIIRAARTKSRMSQSDLGKILGYSSGQFVSNWERGTSYPPMDRLARIVKLFKLNKKQILELYIEETTSEKIREFHAAMRIK